MGFTPLEGLVMGTRPGDVDPGLLLWLLGPDRLDLDELQDGLERRSGLLGLAGDADLRAVARRAGAGEAEAALALDVYLHRLRGRIAAMAASLGGLDVLAFTGGVGEQCPRRRAGRRGRRPRFSGWVGVDEALTTRLRPTPTSRRTEPGHTLVVTSFLAGGGGDRRRVVRALLAAETRGSAPGAAPAPADRGDEADAPGRAEEVYAPWPSSGWAGTSTAGD
jgi:hypothetical protein